MAAFGFGRVTRLASAALLPLLGCPSLMLTSSARTVAPGQVEQAASLGAQRFRIVDADEPFDPGEDLWSPVFEYGVRLGLSEQFDLEARGSLPSGALSIGPRFQLFRGPQEGPGLEVMLVGTVGGIGTEPASSHTWAPFLAAALPLGLSFGEGHQVVLAPRATRIWSDVGDATLLGGSVALVLRVHGDASHGWFLIPECGTADVAADRSLGFRGPVIQCALGLAERRTARAP